MSLGLSMYERVMGAEFLRLGSAVQRFHRLAGRHELHGWVETGAPASFWGTCLAFALGTPRRGGEGPIRFLLQAQTHEETWTRFFPSQVMCSHLQPREGYLVESLGAARLTFALAVRQERLQMRLLRLHFWGLPCPAWLAPLIVAEECGNGERLHFRIEASVPFVGRVASYRGHLVLPQEAQA